MSCTELTGHLYLLDVIAEGISILQLKNKKKNHAYSVVHYITELPLRVG